MRYHSCMHNIPQSDIRAVIETKGKKTAAAGLTGLSLYATKEPIYLVRDGIVLGRITLDGHTGRIFVEAQKDISIIRENIKS